MATAKLPTVPQMVTRSNAAHQHALVSYAAGLYPLDVLAARGLLHEARGMRVAVRTLLRWQCLEVVDGRLRPSKRGEMLLASLDARGAALRETLDRVCAPMVSR